METNVAHGLVIVQWTLMGVLVLAEVLMVPVRATLKRRDTEHTFQQGTCLGAPGCAMLLARAADDWTFAVVACAAKGQPTSGVYVGACIAFTGTRRPHAPLTRAGERVPAASCAPRRFKVKDTENPKLRLLGAQRVRGGCCGRTGAFPHHVRLPVSLCLCPCGAQSVVGSILDDAPGSSNTPPPSYSGSEWSTP